MGMSEYDDEWGDDDDDEVEVEVMIVEDQELFLTSLRDSVSVTVAKDAIDRGSLDKYLTIEQMGKILDDYVDGIDEETGCKFMTEESYAELTADIASTFLGVCLSKLAAADLIESAWDDERGEQVFWTKSKRGKTDD